MSAEPGSPEADALLVARLFARDPAGLGGVALRGAFGPTRDRWLAELRQALPAGTPERRLPTHIADERLLGGLDLSATLAAGRPVAGRGLLAEADGGIVVAAMAERMPAGVAARLAAILDTGSVAVERDGLALRHPARIGLVLLDEGLEDERPPLPLLDRCAFWLELGQCAPEADTFTPRHAEDLRRAMDDTVIASGAEQPRATTPRSLGCFVADAPRNDGRRVFPSEGLPHGVEGRSGEEVSRTSVGVAPDDVTVPDEAVEAICRAALAAGVASLRAPLLAVRAARGLAALAGRSAVAPEDAATAARLVLAPRATTMLQQETAPEPGDDTPPPESEPEAEPDAGEQQDGEAEGPSPEALDDLVLEAVRAAIPAALLDALASGAPPPSGRAAGPGGSGQQARSRLRGRPAGTIRGLPVRGARLALIETLRAAAPWQPIRRKPGETRLAVRRDDLRVTRFKQRRETTTIFVVDASGSSAFQRLAEAKGAVELLLADCYVRRDRVALVSFRGGQADLLLPPTRSLTRAKRSLAALPGGGGTPLASAIEAAARLAGEVARSGGTPLAVFLTDGRANIARDGAPGRERAAADADAAARLFRTAGIAALLVDTSPRPSEAAARIAAAMGARYLPMPSADAASLSRIVGQEAEAAAA